MEKVLVAMSGGVDSSVAALLLRDAGAQPRGVTLRLTDNDDLGLPRERTCCALDDVEDARQAAFRLGIPFTVFDFRAEFGACVMDPFVAAYRSGRTPNPCIDCNRYIKFGKLMRRAAELGAEHVATGHYARVEFDPGRGRWLLRKGLDAAKDQSYVLYALTQEQLSHLLLPLGELTKDRVRALAEEHGFANAHKRDSQDICFVPDGDYAGFITRRTGETFPPGEFIGTAGQVYGQHRGVIHYTIGQRKGLGLSFPQPMYVCRVDPARNEVTLGTRGELFADTLTARDVNLIAVESIPRPMRVTAKIRYRQPEEPATVLQTGPDQLQVTFDRPQRAITPGQALVLYDGDVVVGGGTIC